MSAILPGQLIHNFWLSNNNSYLTSCEDRANRFCQGWDSYTREHPSLIMERPFLQDLISENHKNTIHFINGITPYSFSLAVVTSICLISGGFLSSWLSVAAAIVGITASLFGVATYVFINDTHLGAYESGRFCASTRRLSSDLQRATNELRRRTYELRKIIESEKERQPADKQFLKTFLCDIIDLSHAKEEIESVTPSILQYLMAKLLFHYAIGAYESSSLINENGTPLFQKKTADEISKMRTENQLSQEERDMACAAFRNHKDFYQNLPEKIKPLIQLIWAEIKADTSSFHLLSRNILEAKIPENLADLE